MRLLYSECCFLLLLMSSEEFPKGWSPVRTVVYAQELKEPIVKQPIDSKLLWIFPPEADSSGGNVCKLYQDGFNRRCVEMSQCTTPETDTKLCGWYGTTEAKVCCKIKEPETLPKLTTLACGKEYRPSNGVLLKRSTRMDIKSGPVLSLVRPFDNKPSVVGGVEVERYAYPWMAAVDKKTFGENYRFLCGASLISDRHILTAAHCFQNNDDKSPEKFRVRLRAHLRTGGQKYGVQKIEVHPDYNGKEYYNDIAIIILNDTVSINQEVTPICLPEEETTSVRNITGNNAKVLGWGHVSFGGIDSNVLLEATLPIVDTAECNRKYATVGRTSFPKGITEDHLCAGLEEGGKDACQNDSGGPLQMAVGDRWEQIGIVSFGYGCAEPGYPGVYTKVARYVPWINFVIAGS